MPALPVAAVLAVSTITACSEPRPSASATAATERCVEVAGEMRSIAWSQTGAFLAVAWAQPDGPLGMQLLAADGRPAGPVVAEAAWKAVATPDGRLAWLAGRRGDQVLIEDRPDGRRETELVGDVIDLAWTAVGFALLRRTESEGSEVVLLDVERPAVTQIHETPASIASFWISADPEWLVLTTLGEPPTYLEVPEYDVVGPASRRTIAPAGANATAASMPAFRQHLVYSSDGRMAAIRLDAPDDPVFLGNEGALWGQVSDRGRLAYVTSTDAARLCLVDVAGLLP
jgi:hypothetical protein